MACSEEKRQSVYIYRDGDGGEAMDGYIEREKKEVV